MSSLIKSANFEVAGRVQGVFFRKYTKKTADRFAVFGWVLNTRHGTVQGFMEGTESGVNKMKRWLQTGGSPKSRIDKCSFYNEKTIAAQSHSDFSIIRDAADAQRKTFKT